MTPWNTGDRQARKVKEDNTEENGEINKGPDNNVQKFMEKKKFIISTTT